MDACVAPPQEGEGIVKPVGAGEVRSGDALWCASPPQEGEGIVKPVGAGVALHR